MRLELRPPTAPTPPMPLYTMEEDHPPQWKRREQSAALYRPIDIAMATARQNFGHGPQKSKDEDGHRATSTNRPDAAHDPLHDEGGPSASVEAKGAVGGIVSADLRWPMLIIKLGDLGKKI